MNIYLLALDKGIMINKISLIKGTTPDQHQKLSVMSYGCSSLPKITVVGQLVHAAFVSTEITNG